MAGLKDAQVQGDDGGGIRVQPGQDAAAAQPVEQSPSLFHGQSQVSRQPGIMGRLPGGDTVRPRDVIALSNMASFAMIPSPLVQAASCSPAA